MDVLIFVGVGTIIMAFSVCSIVACANTGRMLREHTAAYLEAKELVGSVKQTGDELASLKEQIGKLRKDAEYSAQTLAARVHSQSERVKELESRVGRIDVAGVECYARSLDAALTDAQKDIATLKRSFATAEKVFEKGALCAGLALLNDELHVSVDGKIPERAVFSAASKRVAEKVEGGQE